MKLNKSSDKLGGVYYTPQLLADYIVYRLFDEGGFEFNKNIDVLEPSVGGGIFLNALLNTNYYKDKGMFKNSMPVLSVDAVEIDETAAAETAKQTKSYTLNDNSVSIINKDYLKYFLNSDKKYDLIIGNPPYVRRRNMNIEQRELCAQVHERAGFKDKNPKNLWTSFFAGAKESLKDNGVIAYVLPADLLQVKYSEELRNILQKDFNRVEVFTLKWIYFDDIEQDVVILICTNQGEKRRQKFIHINSLKELEEPKHYDDYDNTSRLTFNKWTSYLLSGDEYDFLEEIFKRINPNKIKDYCDSGAGIVTAANDYYIVNRKKVDEYSLDSLDGVVKRTIKKSSSMIPAVILTSADLSKKEDEGKEILFVDFPNKLKADLPKNYQKYLKLGEDNGINQRYKMLLRDNWYSVPSVWSSEAFFTKRSHIYPRIIINEGNAHVTDAFYRIRVKEGFDIKNLTFSFYNTFSFVYAELLGRYYGGGVLELTPNEFKDVPVPYMRGSVNAKLRKLDNLVRQESSLAEILNYTDHYILKKQHGFTNLEIVKLRSIYKKLLIRRLKKKDVDL
jgi:adenine-specific DNA-methyltransferase